ncbi:ABC transporter permease [Streptomyces alkaliphilus]|uniref:Transport permease protein n=1 Tax=Streptomyces alkaliphilus TaxID=1472722 RepID=A0A7W3TFC5_9ACTN|nr:ABC transporter permease [Streptomyces alkaliphilus]MBB0245796.1 ABC transporter permease [Streptomyces alkaliphilus]
MIASQAVLETRMLLRHGEQLLLTMVIPTLILVVFSGMDLIDLGAGREDRAGRLEFLAPGVLALAVLSTAFTGQAIATGFERRYGVLKRLGSTPLPRAGLMTAKTGAVLSTLSLQIVLLSSVALALGWEPRGNPFSAALLILLGTAACAGPGLLLAGTLRAEATLAAANLVFVLLLVGGGVVIPLENFPAPVADVLALGPSAALADGLRAVLADGAALPIGPVVILLVWGVASLAAAARFFRWE